MIGLIFLGLLACVHGLGDSFPYNNAFDHVYSDQTVKNWALAGSVCKEGNKQSPIDIDTKAAKVAKPDVGPIMAYGFGADRPIGVQIDGTKTAKPTAVIAYYPDAASGQNAKKTGTAHGLIMGGPLEQVYQFSHVEFHHGKIAGTNPASEHTFDGTRPQMSMNVIFTKTEWTAAQEADRSNDNIGVNYDLAVTASAKVGSVDPAGIAVIAYSIDVGDENAELDPIAKALDTAGSNAKADYGTVPFSTASTVTTWTPGAAYNVNMSALMMLDEGALEDYYYYDGSLTLPAGADASSSATLKAVSCAEIVRWIIPTKRLTMTAAQMAYWNKNNNFAATSNGPTAWARDVQTGDRIKDITVKRRMPVQTTDDAIWRNLASTLLSVGTFGLVHNMLTQDETAKALTENPVVDILQDIEQRFVRPAAPQERQSFNHHHHPQDIQY